MSWLGFVIVGAILLAIGLWAPIGAAWQMVLRFLGGFLLVLGLIFLFVGLAHTNTVDVDGSAAYSLRL